jgi:putative transposase
MRLFLGFDRLPSDAPAVEVRGYGNPDVFNSDQGTQINSGDFTDVVKGEAITISMDGRGRAFDNIFVE